MTLVLISKANSTASARSGFILNSRSLSIFVTQCPNNVSTPSSTYCLFISSPIALGKNIKEYGKARNCVGNPFEGATVTNTAGNVNFGSSYTDIMLSKYKK